MICPECSDDMVEYTFGTLVIDICNRCRGMWFDRDEIEAYVRSRYSSLPGRVPDDSDSLGFTQIVTQPCPRCRTSQLRLGLFKGLSFEKCTSCGGFFLTKKQVAAVLEEARTPPPPHAAAECAGEAVFQAGIAFIADALFDVVGGVFSP